jgi:hypothetical protein
MNSKLFVFSTATVAALLLASVAQAAGGVGSGGADSGRPVAAPNVTTAPILVPGTNIIIPVGSPVGTVIGFAPAGGSFRAAPIALQPTHTNGRPLEPHFE